MRLAIGVAIAAAAIGGGRIARTAARDLRTAPAATTNRPYTPSASAARFLSLGYREALADVLYVRMLGHFMSNDSTGDAVADLAEAVAALDPQFFRIYEHGAQAMTLAKHGVHRRVFERAITLLEAGAKAFPDDWRLPYLAGQIYTQDLVTDDPAQRRAWDERGTLLVESAIRKPGAPAGLATWAAHMRKKLGQQERAVAGLREMLLITNDEKSRKRLIEALANLQERNAEELAIEMLVERRKFEEIWRTQRRSLPASMFILLGPRIRPGFDMTELATGGADVIEIEEEETLEPLE